MELEILVSKKGTKVVLATNLYEALQLPNGQYAKTVKSWMRDVYEFRDGIRQPEPLKDFAKRHFEDGEEEDFYLTVELAKLITLNSTSKEKRRFANHLLSLDDKVENAELLTKDQVVAVLELAKAMGFVSCQTISELKHFQKYEAENGSPVNWGRHRERLLGYSTEELLDAPALNGVRTRGKSQRELLIQVDKYETIRAAVIDLFMAHGKSEMYARNVGDLAKVFAKELNVEIQDDSHSAIVFPNSANAELVREIKTMDKGAALSCW